MLQLLLLSGLFQSGHGFQRLELAHRQVADRHAVCVRHVVMLNGVHVMYNGRLQQQQRTIVMQVCRTETSARKLLLIDNRHETDHVTTR